MVLVLGLLLGSFLNVVIYRLPRMLLRQWQEECQNFLKEASELDNEKINLWGPGSHCPHCKAPIKAWQNIPLFSFILQKGRCAQCKTKISYRYPLVELLSCLILLAVLWVYGFTLVGLAFGLLTLGLIALAFIDLDESILPDNITLPLLWLGLLFSLQGSFIPPEDAILGAAAGYGSLWLVANIYKLLRHKEGMGQGDYKLLALLGAWTGWQTLPFILLLSSVVGAIISISLIALRRHTFHKPIPFGPYLCLAGFITIIYPHWLQWFYQWIGP
ncbi:MAG: A24 family peptidase [Gammaproteobacteria bacterium]|nr:A24 family peptidase [Gammaproteobacteria bacterium]